MRRSILAGVCSVIAVAAAAWVLSRPGAPPDDTRAERAPVVVGSAGVGPTPREEPPPDTEYAPVAPVAPPWTTDGGPSFAPGQVPDDIRGTGACSLRIRLVDQDGAYVAARVRLWRLGLPERDDWSAGDHIQADVVVGAEGTTVGDLPAGRYRAEITAQRSDADDPPEFRVSGDDAVALPVVIPRERPVRCILFGADGTRLTRARVRRGGGGAWWGEGGTPPWAKPRMSWWRSTSGGAGGATAAESARSSSTRSGRSTRRSS